MELASTTMSSNIHQVNLRAICSSRAANQQFSVNTRSMALPRRFG